jgi:hypothetical protein
MVEPLAIPEVPSRALALAYERTFCRPLGYTFTAKGGVPQSSCALHVLPHVPLYFELFSELCEDRYRQRKIVSKTRIELVIIYLRQEGIRG